MRNAPRPQRALGKPAVIRHPLRIALRAAALAAIALFSSCDSDAGSLDELPLDELSDVGVDQLPITDRYDLIPASINDEGRITFLLDSSLGRIWCGFVPFAPADAPPDVTMPVTHWERVLVSPEAEGHPLDTGRFRISVSIVKQADIFLVDSAAGRVWGCRSTSDGKFVFEETPVEAK